MIGRGLRDLLNAMDRCDEQEKVYVDSSVKLTMAIQDRRQTLTAFLNVGGELTDKYFEPDELIVLRRLANTHQEAK